jgi:hypothetical protein
MNIDEILDISKHDNLFKALNELFVEQRKVFKVLTVGPSEHHLEGENILFVVISIHETEANVYDCASKLITLIKDNCHTSLKFSYYLNLSYGQIELQFNIYDKKLFLKLFNVFKEYFNYRMNLIKHTINLF